MRKTDWFPPEVKPVRIGLYETNNPTYEKVFRVSENLWFWDGKQWCADNQSFICNQQNRVWRGLTAPAE